MSQMNRSRTTLERQDLAMLRNVGARSSRSRQHVALIAICVSQAIVSVACGSDAQHTVEPVMQAMPAGTTATAPTTGPAAAGKPASAPGIRASAAGAQANVTKGSAGATATSPAVSMSAGAAGMTTAASAAGNAAAATASASAGGMTGAATAAAAGGGAKAGAGAPGAGSGTCIASKPASATVTGTGPHKVVAELNSGPAISEGTIFRPAELKTEEKYPIFAFGENGCIQNSLEAQNFLGEVASHGYFVIADGHPDGAYMPRSNNGGDVVSQGKPLIAYIDWIIAENDKPCSAYYQSIDTTKIATSGTSCGGLMATGTSGDPRLTTYTLNSSGLFAEDANIYKNIHTPVLYVLGSSSDVAYSNGKRDFNAISALGKPIMLFSSRTLGHGGDFRSPGGGNFGKLNLAWFNWHLKGDMGPTGKGFFIGDTCTLCKDSGWEVASANIQ